MTPLDLISGALKRLGVAGAGEVVTGEDAEDVYTFLNGLLESWRLERLMAYAVRRSLFTLTPGLDPHTIGSSGTFDTTRPVRIERAGLVDLSGYELPLEVFNVQRYSTVGIKATTSSLPVQLYYETVFPLGNIHLYPVPTDALQLALYLWEQLTTFGDFDTGGTATIELPPGYQRALETNLAIEAAPMFGKTPSDLLISQARDSKAAIKSLNQDVDELSCDAALLSRTSGDSQWWRTGGL